MADEAGSSSPAVGMLRCSRCNRYYAPEDCEGFGRKDFLSFAIECRGCFARRTETR